jgi:hypothetical protein
MTTTTFDQTRTARLAALQTQIEAKFEAGEPYADLQARFDRIYNSACNFMAGTGDDLDFTCIAPAGHAGDHDLVDAYNRF